jgi:hypothetical protein
MEKAVIATGFPKAKSVARRLGVSQARTHKLVNLMDGIATDGRVFWRRAALSKKHHVAKKKK